MKAKHLTGGLRYPGQPGAAYAGNPQNRVLPVRQDWRPFPSGAGHLVINEDIFYFFGAV
ncbi:hypothetical protein D3C87_2102790 [compost metagenome]